MLFDFHYKRLGLTFVDVVIGVAILVMLFGGIYLVYFSILDVVSGLEVRSAATAALNRQFEIIRNLPYENVGVVNGVPAGVIPYQQTVAIGEFSFEVKATIRNVDDPFDGTLGGNPNDTAPADYKLVELEVVCSVCSRFVPLVLTGRVSPKNLESASNDGSLFINVIDASGIPISEAQVHVVNVNVSPGIDLYDATNLNGSLQLVGVPTSTQSYQIEVTKSGYSSDRTYTFGDPDNPNPLISHATVAAQTVTEITFSIDRLSLFNVSTTDVMCASVGGRSFSIEGAKPIGTNPEVLKFSTTSVTDAYGGKLFNGLEWDAYSLALTEVDYDILGTIPLSPYVVNPSSTNYFTFIVQPYNPNSLLVTVKGQGSEVPGASVTLTKAGFSETLITGRSLVESSDWSGGAYSGQDGGVETEATPGSIELVQNASSTYTTSTPHWLISQTFDFGSASTTFYNLTWSPEDQSPLTGSESLKFQLSANNDQATWDFLGPDGTSGTFYSVSSSTINSIHSGKRYLRYKVFMETESEFVSPVLDEVSVGFSGKCVPPTQVLFNNLSSGDYLVTVAAAGYITATSSVSVSGAWQQIEIPMQSP